MKESEYLGLSEKELYAALVWGLVAGSSVNRIRARWWRVALCGALSVGLAAGAARMGRRSRIGRRSKGRSSPKNFAGTP